MNSYGKSLAVLALCVATAACADRLALDVRCTPRGAEILVGGKVVGTCPATVRYEIGEEDKKRGTLQVKEMTVRWLSGASVTIPATTADLKQGYSREIAIARPQDHPGNDVDMKRARELEEEEARQRELEAQKLRLGGNGGGGGGGGGGY